MYVYVYVYVRIYIYIYIYIYIERERERERERESASSFLRIFESLTSKYMLPVPCIFVYSVYGTTNAHNEMAHSAEALRYKPKGRGFNSRWCHWNFSLT